MATKGNILKDSYYKERLSKKTDNGMSLHTTNLFNGQNEMGQSDTDQIIISAEQEKLDFRKYLSNLAQTSSGETYAFLNFVCTHKKLPSIHKIGEYKYLELIDLSYNSLTSLKYLSGLKYIREIRATNNQLITILDMKEIPLYLDTVDLSSNAITSMPNLEKHKFLRVLKLQSNKINLISGIEKNKNLQILDISENCLEELKGLDNLNLTQLYLANNQIQSAKGLSKLDHLRTLNLSVNKISKLGGFVNLVSLRELNLAKNNIRHVRQIDYLQNLMYLTSLDLCYNPIQQRKYYRLQLVYKLPMLQKLDGTNLNGAEVVQAESLYGLDVEQKYNIFKRYLTEEQFIDHRIHKSELIENETDSGNDNNNLVDEYDEEGRKTHSNSRSKNSKGFNASKRSNFSKQSKNSKGSSLSKN